MSSFNRFVGLIVSLCAINVAMGEYQFSTLSGAITLDAPSSITVDPFGNLYVVEFSTNAIRKITPSGIWTTFAGTPGVSGSSDGLEGNSLFDFPQGAASDSSGNIYVADTGNNSIRKINSAGLVTTLAGTSGGGGGSGGGSSNGSGASASFFLPYGVAVDQTGNVYVADTFNHTIRKITPDGITSTLAGSPGISGYIDSSGSSARFFYPKGLAVDASGNVYVADSANHAIRKVTPSGVVTTVAGSGQLGNVDGLGTAARFAFPHGLAVDGSGNIYVADTSNNSIRKVTREGLVTTLGGVSVAGNADGMGLVARFNLPDSITVDAVGNIYVADTGNSTVRKGVYIASTPNYAADFNGDGFADILWENSLTGERFVWFMNARGHIGGSSLGVVSTDWSIVASADFNADGKSDILWQNQTTGERFVWFMNETAHIGGSSLGVVSTDWSIVASADFNADGKPDILWENPTTGERFVWFMDGTGHIGGNSLGLVSTDWSIVAATDFDGYNGPDILWQNSVTGQRYLWLMSGLDHQSDVDLGIVSTDWSIAY